MVDQDCGCGGYGSSYLVSRESEAQRQVKVEMSWTPNNRPLHDTENLGQGTQP